MSGSDELWLAPRTWREVQAGLDHLLTRYADCSRDLVARAESITRHLAAVDLWLEDLCTQTCPACSDPCCLRAVVRYDFRDLLFVHCAKEALPLTHPKPYSDQACSMLGGNGCRLPRTWRPFLCTWYLCPSQMELVRQAETGPLAELPKRLQFIQHQRKDLEEVFIQMVVPDTTATVRALSSFRRKPESRSPAKEERG